MWRIIKALVALGLLGAVAFVAYAYVGPVFNRADFEAPTETITETVILEVE